VQQINDEKDPAGDRELGIEGELTDTVDPPADYIESIIPADNWFAVYDDGKGGEFRTRVACWAKWGGGNVTGIATANRQGLRQAETPGFKGYEYGDGSTPAPVEVVVIDNLVEKGGGI
jgi:hypothetical protein